MRVSTAGIHAAALTLLNERNAQIAKLQNQIGASTRILTPADDPIGAGQALELDRALSESKQHQRNTDIATNRLSLEEQTLADTTELLQRVRTLALQANSGTMDNTSRESIANEIEVRLKQLVDLANRKDGNGEYLFSGYSTLTKPFAQSGTTVTYMGDGGARLLQTGPSQRVPDGHPGNEVFMNIVRGNGTFVTGAANTNTGDGVISGGIVTNATAWVPDTYTIVFDTPTTYEVFESGGDSVMTGTFAPGDAIAFNGIQFEIEGAPATGDTFTVSPAGTQDMFTTVANLLATLKRPTEGAGQNALYATEIAQALTQLDHSLDNVTSVRGEVGARLSMLSDAADDQVNRQLDLQTSLSGIRDLDYAEAITQLNLQLVGLQAAQASYSKISQLSLFNYL